MTVLVLAAERDPTADRMICELDRRNTPVVRCDTAWFPTEMSLTALFRNGAWNGSLIVRGRSVPLSDLSSVWYRSPGTFVFPEQLTPTERHWAGTEAKLGLGGVLTSLPMRWINHPARAADAAAKPLQLVTAAMCGLTVPDTLVTNAPDDAAAFAGTAPTVTKALGAASVVERGGRATMFTNLLTDAEVRDLRGVEVTTHQFQRWVPKAYEARVIVVGGRVFAAGIHAGTPETVVDWRNSYADLAYSRIDIPVHIRCGVVDYCRALGLTYGAFDFVIAPDGRWLFLECNPGGQYGWIEDAVSAPVTSALADLLTEARLV